MRKKVALFIRSLELGGAEHQSIYIAAGLSRTYTLKLIVFYNRGDLIPKAMNILGDQSIYFVEGKNILHKLLNLYLFFKAEKYDVLFCFLPMNNIIGLTLGRLSCIKNIYGGIRSSKKKAWHKMFVQKFLMNRYSTGIISNSYAGKDAYISYGIKEEKISVIHNGIIKIPNKIERKENRKVNLLNVSRFVAEKDFLTTFKVLDILNKRGILEQYGVKHFIVGYGVLEDKIYNYVSEYGLKEYVSIIINPMDVEQYYIQSDIFFTTSRHEGMPNSIMEAVSWSLPVVCTDAGDSRYLVLNNKSGFVNEVGDYNNLAESLITLIKNHKMRILFGEAGYLNLTKNFNLNTMIDKYCDIIERS